MKIDPHVHFRDEEQSYKETIAHGLSVARDQGVDIEFDPFRWPDLLTDLDSGHFDVAMSGITVRGKLDLGRKSDESVAKADTPKPPTALARTIALR